MQTIEVTTSQILGREISGALALPVLLKRVSDEQRRSTGGVTVLLRELESHPDIFRVLRPCVGPWITERNRGRKTLSSGPWILLRTPGASLALTRTQTLLVETVRQVGCHVEAESFTALARWLLLVGGADHAWRALHSVALNHPERHSSSTSTSTKLSPRDAAAA